MLEHAQNTQEEHPKGGCPRATIRELRRSGGRHRAVLVTASAHFRDRLRAGSHGRRQAAEAIREAGFTRPGPVGPFRPTPLGAGVSHRVWSVPQRTDRGERLTWHTPVESIPRRPLMPCSPGIESPPSTASPSPSGGVRRGPFARRLRASPLPTRRQRCQRVVHACGQRDDNGARHRHSPSKAGPRSRAPRRLGRGCGPPGGEAPGTSPVRATSR